MVLQSQTAWRSSWGPFRLCDERAVKGDSEVAVVGTDLLCSVEMPAVDFVGVAVVAVDATVPRVSSRIDVG